VGSDKSFGEVMQQIAEFLKGLSFSQKLFMAGAALIAAGTLFAFVRVIGKPEYKTLYSGMEPRDAQALAEKLKSKNIPFQLSADGTAVSVPADRIDSGRLEAASEGGPRTGRLGFEIFDKTNWAGSDFSEKVNYQRALEGELERTIQTLRGVEAARVHLVLPPESIFSDRNREAKASVILKLRSGRLPDDAQNTIAYLVASAVDQLRPENVTVVNADTGRPFRPAAAGPGDSAGTELEQQLAARLVHTLEPVVGAEGVRASVRVERELSSSEQSEEKYDPATTVATMLQKREEQTNGELPGGIPGTSSNVPSGQTAPIRTSGTQHSLRSEEGTYVSSHTRRRVTHPAGGIKRIAAALLIDDAIEPKNGDSKGEVRRKRTAEEMKKIEDLARAALGMDSSRGDLLVVQNLSFREPPVAAPEPVSRLTRMRIELNRWADLVRYGLIALVFVVVYLVLLRPIKREVVSSFRKLPARVASQRMATATAGGVIESALPSEIDLAEASPEARRAVALKRQVLEKIKAEPATATRLVQSWLRKDES
jgi:flagellar M-ring protein FliF